MSACRFQPRARLTYGASADASRWLLAGTTSTRPRSAPTCWSWLTSGASSRFQDAAGAVRTMSSTLLKPIQKLSPAKARTRAYQRRLRGTAYGRAASSATPANSIAIRVMFDPICESTTYVSSVPSPYTAAAVRTVLQSRGTRKKTSTAKTNGSDSVPSDIGCVPENGNSQEDRPTTATGARPIAYAPGR